MLQSYNQRDGIAVCHLTRDVASAPAFDSSFAIGSKPERPSHTCETAISRAVSPFCAVQSKLGGGREVSGHFWCSDKDPTHQIRAPLCSFKMKKGFVWFEPPEGLLLPPSALTRSGTDMKTCIDADRHTQPTCLQ